jgi:hypothetical protein
MVSNEPRKRICCDTDISQYHLESCKNFMGYPGPESPLSVGDMEKAYGLDAEAGESELDKPLAGLDFIRDQVHATAIDKGWWENGERNFGEVIALMHSELSEAYEEYRNGHAMNEVYYRHELVPGSDFEIEVDSETEVTFKKPGKPEGIPVELVDVLIRIFDWAGYYKISLGEILAKKMHYNTTRPYRHGGKKS